MTKNHPHLTRRRLLMGTAATYLLTVSQIGMAALSQVIAIRIWPSSAYTRVTIESSAPLQYKQFSLSNPDRIVVDIEGIQLNSILKQAGNLVQSTDPYLREVRVGQFNQQTVRLVFGLKQQIKPELFVLAPVAEFRHRLVLDLYPQSFTAAQEEEDPLLALLEEYNKGELNKDKSVTESKPVATGREHPLIVVLDPGHGGEDPGAIGRRGTREKDVVLQIARRLRSLIQQQKNMRVYMTRNEDIFIPLQVRVAKARKLRADLFISIHADAFTHPSARGSSVFALSKRGATSSAAQFLAKSQNEADEIGGVSRSGDRYLDQTMFDLVQTATISDSLKFGKKVLHKMGGINRLHKRQVEQAGFAVLKAPDIPSILVETAFISNPQEEQQLRSSAFQQQIAHSIMDGIIEFSQVLRAAKKA